MTTLNADWYPEIISGFDPLVLKAQIQADILRETAGMSDEEVRAFFRKGSEEFQTEIKQRRQELAKQQ